ncbi:LppM family (lipo)protein [Sanguibacter sp. Z1732]|uniref:LppM family (lipo)protein n=1 Tax=Sanguibacter sp. Z1732 TaxID=3435412 RepID=UPI003D9CA6B8
MTSWIWRPVGAVLLALVVLTGCVRLDGGVTISTDDTLSGDVVVAVSQAWAEANGQDPYALQRILDEEIAAAPDAGIAAEPFEDGEYIGATLTLTDVPIERIEESTSGALIVAAEEDGHIVAGRFGDLDLTAPDGAEEDDQVATPWMIDLSVTFPEAVTDHDGTLVGRTVSWDLEPGDDTLFATTQAAASPYRFRFRCCCSGCCWWGPASGSSSADDGGRQRASSTDLP